MHLSFNKILRLSGSEVVVDDASCVFNMKLDLSFYAAWPKKEGTFFFISLGTDSLISR